ncbi:MAG TPA: ferredoxin [Candidatus Magasanikbacteria bacterium]|nr:ferredoxin [Candidatus Magasanikbacteria bacterium]HBX15838.1 ferredoxin [Candidatus Magasanikbacteria bacterium]
MNIIIDKEKCIGCGTCVALSPGSYKWSEDNLKAEAILPPGDELQAVKDAASACPTLAIVVKE